MGLHLRTSSALFALLFLLMITIGGSSGVILGNAAVDLALHDSYYVPAHFHFVLTFVGILLTFSPMHFLGFNLMPRRIEDFPDSFHSWNFLSSIGSGITLLSFAIIK